MNSLFRSLFFLVLSGGLALASPATDAPAPVAVAPRPLAPDDLDGVSPASLPIANAMVLEQIRSMPTGGGYSASHAATVVLGASVRPVPGGLRVDAAQAQPSYCSGATYLVFLKTVNALQRTGEVTLDLPTANALRSTASATARASGDAGTPMDPAPRASSTNWTSAGTSPASPRRCPVIS